MKELNDKHLFHLKILDALNVSLNKVLAEMNMNQDTFKAYFPEILFSILEFYLIVGSSANIPADIMLDLDREELIAFYEAFTACKEGIGKQS